MILVGPLVSTPLRGDARVLGGDVGEPVNAAGAGGNAGRGHPDVQEESECIDTEMTLAACDLRAGVDALAGCGHLGRPGALGIRPAGTRFSVVAIGWSTRRRRRPLRWSNKRFLTRHRIGVDRLPQREVVPDVASLDARAVDIQDRVHEAARIVLEWAPDVPAIASSLGPAG
jgi:hypothetical protein